MKYFDGVIVVEGKNDASYLSSFIGAEYVVLNGYEQNNDTLNYLSYVSKQRNIILLTDPDDAGQTIREKFLKTGIKCINVVLDYNKCNKHGKHGVAECEKNEILDKFNDFLQGKEPLYGFLEAKDFIKLGVFGNKTAQNIIKHTLNIGECNYKTMIKRINYNRVSYDDIERALRDNYGN